MKKTILLVVVVLVIVIVGYVVFGTGSDATVKTPMITQDEHSDLTSTEEVTEIEIKASNWKFTPELVEVNLGDKVELHLQSTEGTHGFTILEFGVSEKLSLGEDVHIEFVADKLGTFNMFCHISCGRGHGGMNGLFVVK